MGEFFALEKILSLDEILPKELDQNPVEQLDELLLGSCSTLVVFYFAHEQADDLAKICRVESLVFFQNDDIPLDAIADIIQAQGLSME